MAERADWLHLTPLERGQLRPPGPEAVVEWFAVRQHRCAARRQLLRAGVDPRWIDRRVSSGALRVVHRGVYAVGQAQLSREGRWMAGVLAGGPGAVLGRRTAAEHLRLRDGGGRAIDVLVPRTAHSRPGLMLIRARDLRPEDVSIRAGIPVTTVARTFLDSAAVLDRAELRRMIAQARRLGVLDEAALRTQCQRHGGHPGAGTLRRLVLLLPDRTESELEDLMLALLRARDLDLGVQVNHRLDAAGRWVRTDFRWPGRRVVVEVDGWGSHGGRAAFEEDLDRELDLRVDGWTVLRFGWRQVVDRPAVIARVIARALAGRT